MADRREAIAYHEAGHAVISMKLGYKCLYATIIPDGDRVGHVCCEDPIVTGHENKIEHALKVLLSAGLSEAKQLRRPTWGDADDRVKVQNLALLATQQDGERAAALTDDLVTETRMLVEKHWPEIDKLAQRLLVDGSVNFLQVKPGATFDRPLRPD